jgi:hypothetical protein
MKKLGKLSINPERVIKNEELVNLRGGYSCTVTTNCIGGSISCTGNSSCSRTSTSVTCDEKTTYC